MIPDEAVEAAARDLAVVAWGEWEYVPNELRSRFLRDARICLEAAAPHLMAAAAADLRGWYQERIDEVPADDVTLTEYETGREVGITEGILAASLKIGDTK